MLSPRDWWSCDGQGGRESERPRHATPASATAWPDVEGFTRRGVLATFGLAALAWAMPRTALSQVAVSPESNGNVLVCVFLRGGLDGLSAVVPYADDDYHRARPSLGLGAPNDRNAAGRTLKLSDTFGLSPALGALMPLYESRQMAVVHAVGSRDQTRSHFEAMNAMERGLAAPGEGDASGWLARHLAARPASTASPLRAVAFGGVMPDSLRGAPGATAIQKLEDFRLQTRDAQSARARLGKLYADGTDEMAVAGRETLSVLDTLNRLDVTGYRPQNRAAYPTTGFGQGLRQAACLIRADVGLEIASLDMGGWDTHVAQGTAVGWLPTLLQELGDSLAAFAQDLGPTMRNVTISVQTEFGRRVAENAGLGTDHGRGSVMFLIGGGVQGGQVHADWPGLAPEKLEEPGDLRVTTDYRDVMAELLSARTPNPAIARVFPGHRPKSLGLIKAS